VLLAWVIAFSLIGSVGAMAGALALFLFPAYVRKTLLPSLLSYATGALLGAAFLGLLPHALEKAPVFGITGTVLAGIVGFFVLEKIILWRHCHQGECDIHGRAGPLILIGDAFHNFVDGVVIAAAFLASIPLGIAASLAVIAHEIPQEIGDFAILLDSGYGRARALSFNLLSSLASLPGAIIGYYFVDYAKQSVPYVLALSAGSFLYIAVADLVPSLHRQVGIRAGIQQFMLMVIGIGAAALLGLNG
jgi:zinc and cadmium transporter